MRKQTVQVKIDTGAEVTAENVETYKKLNDSQLQKQILHGPTHQSLQVIGQFTTTLTHDQKSTKQTVFVVRGLKNNLLGLPAIKGLQLLCRTEEIESQVADRSEIRKKYSKLFEGLGNFGDPYTIQLSEDVWPYALYTPRAVPFPLRQKVIEELERMESLGVITKIEEPTEWCSGMVVVPKSNGTVRICVDLKPLNRGVLREAHPIPTVDDILAQITKGAFFSKLDAKRVLADTASRTMATTDYFYHTNIGRYCFKKLPFGISSPPEVFQKRSAKVLTGLPGVVSKTDDILTIGS